MFHEKEQGTLPNEDMEPFPLEETRTTGDKFVVPQKGQGQVLPHRTSKKSKGGSVVGLGETSGAQAEQPPA